MCTYLELLQVWLYLWVSNDKRSSLSLSCSSFSLSSLSRCCSCLRSVSTNKASEVELVEELPEEPAAGGGSRGEEDASSPLVKPELPEAPSWARSARSRSRSSSRRSRCNRSRSLWGSEVARRAWKFTQNFPYQRLLLRFHLHRLFLHHLPHELQLRRQVGIGLGRHGFVASAQTTTRPTTWRVL